MSSLSEPDHLLGYVIMQIATANPGEPAYRVTCAHTAVILAQFRDRQSAEHYILQRELPVTTLRPPHPVY